MISLLAPSKTMDMDTHGPHSRIATKPLFLAQASMIADALKHKSHAEIMDFMKVSSDIAANVEHMYKAWSTDPKAKTISKPALWAYKGDVYKGVKADNLEPDAAKWAEEHILILSGLYGLVRPFDAVQRYRLEMKAKLPVGDAKDLYEFWGSTLAEYVVERANGVVCCLSSDEYARVVLRHLPKDVRVVTPVFYDSRPNGTIGTAPIYNKMMRGVVARWLIDHKVDDPDHLKDFTGHDYRYNRARSTADMPAFYRPEMKPLVF